LDAYTGLDGELTGTARTAQETLDRTGVLNRQLELARKRRELERKRILLEANLRALQAEFAAEEEEVAALLEADQQSEQMRADAENRIAQQRGRERPDNGG
jgi:circadian clock protein KaiC